MCGKGPVRPPPHRACNDKARFRRAERQGSTLERARRSAARDRRPRPRPAKRPAHRIARRSAPVRRACRRKDGNKRATGASALRLPGRAGERLLLSVVDFESREELIVAAPQLERDGSALIELGEQLVDLRSGLRFSRLSALNDRQNDVAWLNVTA